MSVLNRASPNPGGPPIGMAIGLGGALGAMARYAVAGWSTTWAAAAFPWGTLAVNLAGSALLGVVVRATVGAPEAQFRRAFLAIGFCGGLTTFSTFDLEILVLLMGGRPAVAALYAALSVGGCLLAVAFGMVAGERLRRKAEPPTPASTPTGHPIVDPAEDPPAG
jgi:fluoride exporter